MEFYNIVNRRVGGEPTHKSASFLYTSFVGRINFKYLITQKVFILVGEARPSTDTRLSTDGLGPRLAPNRTDAVGLG